MLLFTCAWGPVRVGPAEARHRAGCRKMLDTSFTGGVLTAVTAWATGSPEPMNSRAPVSKMRKSSRNRQESRFHSSGNLDSGRGAELQRRPVLPSAERTRSLVARPGGVCELTGHRVAQQHRRKGSWSHSLSRMIPAISFALLQAFYFIAFISRSWLGVSVRPPSIPAGACSVRDSWPGRRSPSSQTLPSGVRLKVPS